MVEVWYTMFDLNRPDNLVADISRCTDMKKLRDGVSKLFFGSDQRIRSLPLLKRVVSQFQWPESQKKFRKTIAVCYEN
jgi:hypothetical protein